MQKFNQMRGNASKNWHHAHDCGKPFNLFINCLLNRLTFDQLYLCFIPERRKKVRSPIDSTILNLPPITIEPGQTYQLYTKLKSFCGTVLCWLMIRQALAREKNDATMEKANQMEMVNEMTVRKNDENRFANGKWCRMNPDKSYITIGIDNRWSDKPNSMANNDESASSRSNQPIATHKLQFAIKVLSITTEITWKIPLVDLHRTHLHHSKVESKRVRFCSTACR